MNKELQTPFHRSALTEGQSSLAYEVFQGVGEVQTEVMTGHHGHEFPVIGIVRTELNHRIVTGKLKHSHLRVSHAHPEAISTRTRDGNGVDLNRQFPVPGEMPVYPGAKLLRRVSDQFPIKYVFSFHEDNEGDPTKFYYYDHSWDQTDPQIESLAQWARGELIGAMHSRGFGTHTGLDAPDLGNRAENGYIRTNIFDTTSELYLVDLGARGMGTVQRAFVFEIPGCVSRAEKKAHVDLILDTFVLPFLDAALPVH